MKNKIHKENIKRVEEVEEEEYIKTSKVFVNQGN